jgi:hypothetical protein
VTAVNIKIAVFWNGTSCTLIGRYECRGEAASSVCRLDVSQRGRMACYVERGRKKKGCGKYASFHKFAKPSVLFSVTNYLAPLGQREC